MTCAQLIAMAKHNIAYVKAGTIDQEDDVIRVRADHYYDAEHWRREMTPIFRRIYADPELSRSIRAWSI